MVKSLTSIVRLETVRLFAHYLNRVAIIKLRINTYLQKSIKLMREKLYYIVFVLFSIEYTVSIYFFFKRLGKISHSVFLYILHNVPTL